MGHLAFVTGPVRSGKSRFALALARSRGEAGVYLAAYRADPEDAEMLQDLVISAVNEALRQADDAMNSSMSSLTGGLNIPGLGL